MKAEAFGLGSATNSGLLIDTNLLVLFTIGTVNRGRIETFKRTRKYSITDYDLLVRVISKFEPLYSVAHVLAEVSNLTDLSGTERLQARCVLKQTISLLNEVEISSTQAAEDRLYNDLGLVDAAIGAVARAHNCAVLTDDLDLYLLLSHDKVNVLNFSHLRANAWGI
ncbi:MAG TPA: PIN domain-containing protein [Armatimonadota bacterium]|jgi:predicted nucleic acid-binding protein